MSKIEIMGALIDAQQKTFTVYPDVTSFGAKMLMVDGRPAFLFDGQVKPDNLAVLEGAGWSIERDRLFQWREPTIGIAVLRQLFPQFGNAHVRRNVQVDFVAADDLLDALEAAQAREDDALLSALGVTDAEIAAVFADAMPDSKARSSDIKDGSKKTIDDTGKKIGGAKKDRVMRLSDVGSVRDEIFSMGQIEIVKDIKKRAIWNFQATSAIKNGMSVKKAILIRETLSAWPSWNSAVQISFAGGSGSNLAMEKSLDNLRRAAAFYSSSLLKLRDALLSGNHDYSRSPSQLKEALTEGASDHGDVPFIVDATVDRIIAEIGATVDETEARQRAMVSDSRATRTRTRGGYSLNDYVKVRMISTAHSGAINDKDWNLSREEYLQKHDKSNPPDEDATPKTSKPDDDARPHLADILRVGLPVTRTGDIEPEDFIATFGFRAVEFGNWLPNDERQDVLNKAYDAFMTLSLVTGIPIESIGLKGIHGSDGLALAFGARGNGGRRSAAAHFEPGRAVMNLTRMYGAGSLAHEYGHALDMFSAQIADRAGYKERGHTKNGYMLTNRFAESNSLYGCPVVIRKDNPAEQQALQDMLSSFHRLSAGFVFSPLLRASHTAVSRLDAVVKHKRVAADILVSVMPRDRRAALLAKIPIEPAKPDAAKNAGWTEVSRAIEEASNGTHANDRLIYVMSRIINSDLENSSDLGRNASLYNRMANLKDVERSKSSRYFASPHEMFARAFESFVQDKLKALAPDGKGRDDYLVFGTDDGDLRYPLTHERAAYNDKFEVLCRSLVNCLDMLCPEVEAEQMTPGM